MKKGSGGKLTNLQSFIISSLFLITVIVLMNSISDLESFIWFFVGIILCAFWFIYYHIFFG
jgi:hypothetical protein